MNRTWSLRLAVLGSLAPVMIASVSAQQPKISMKNDWKRMSTFE